MLLHLQSLALAPTPAIPTAPCPAPLNLKLSTINPQMTQILKPYPIYYASGDPQPVKDHKTRKSRPLSHANGPQLRGKTQVRSRFAASAANNRMRGAPVRGAPRSCQSVVFVYLLFTQSPPKNSKSHDLKSSKYLEPYTLIFLYTRP